MSDPQRCRVYFELMVERDRRATSLRAALAAHPDGGGLHTDVRYASNMLEAAQLAETAHLHDCRQCQDWLAWIDRTSTYCEPTDEQLLALEQSQTCNSNFHA